LSFVRSTNLDKWKVHELKAMEAGGNANAKTFFRDHGVTDMKTESKYQTRAAELYRHKLKELIDDKKKKTTSVVAAVDTAKAASPVISAATSSPSATQASAPTTTKPKKEAPTFQWEEEEQEEDVSKKYVPPAASKTTQDTRVETKTAGRLGAKKVSNTSSKSFFADFDLEDDEEEKEQELPPPPSNKSRNQADDVSSRFSRLSYVDDEPKNKNSPNQERSSTSSSDRNKGSPLYDNRGGRNNSNRPAGRERDEAPDYARKNFSSAKAISSDQYFGTDKQDGNSQEREIRLSKFANSSAISSADYFDRDESVTIADMTASDVARKFAYNAKSDLGQISNVVGEGAKKLSNIASSFLNDLQDRYS